MKFFTDSHLNPADVVSESGIVKTLKRINRHKDDPEEILSMDEYLQITGLHEVTAEEAYRMYDSSATLYDNVALALISAAGLEIPTPAGDTLDEMNLCEKAVEVLGFRAPRFVSRKF